MFTYKPIKLNEVDLVYDLYQRVINSTPVWGWDKDYPSKDMLINDITSNHLVGYYDNDKIIAVSFIGPVNPNEEVPNWKLEIKNPARWARICVDPTYQGKGVGYAFTKCIISDLINQGYDGIRIKVAKDNISAIKLYDKFGFLNQGNFNFIDIDWLCYELNIVDYFLLVEIEEIIKKQLDENAKIIKKLNTTNNKVFIVSYNNKDYVFKVYHSKTWPEDGKLIYVNNLLDKNNIKHANIYSNTCVNNVQCLSYYSDKCLNNKIESRYMIEEKIQGCSPLNNLNTKDMQNAYNLLALYIKKVHKITFEKFGYLNNGSPEYNKFSEYILDTLHDNLPVLIDNNILQIDNIDNFIESISLKFDKYNLSPCLCHGDLSMRNVIIENNNLSLIDWDDAMAYPAYADIARMTFDMRYIHDKDHNQYKSSFLNTYLENNEMATYLEFEKLYHIFVAIDFLAHSIKIINTNSKYQDMIQYLTSLIKELL